MTNVRKTDGRNQIFIVYLYLTMFFRAGMVLIHQRDKDLDILVNDKDKAIREFVSLIGRKQDLEKLQFDKNKEVRKKAQKGLNLNVVKKAY